MSEPDESFLGPIGDQLGLMTGQLGAALAEAMRPPRYEYARVVWDDVAALAADGWELAHVQQGYLTAVDGDVVCEGPLYVMSRKVSAASEAEEMLRDASSEAGR